MALPRSPASTLASSRFLQSAGLGRDRGTGSRTPGSGSGEYSATIIGTTSTTSITISNSNTRVGGDTDTASSCTVTATNTNTRIAGARDIHTATSNRNNNSNSPPRRPPSPSASEYNYHPASSSHLPTMTEKPSPTLPFSGAAWLSPDSASGHLRPPMTASSTTTSRSITETISSAKSASSSASSSSSGSTVTHIAPAPSPQPTYLSLPTLPGPVLASLLAGTERLAETTERCAVESRGFLKALRRERERRVRAAGRAGGGALGRARSLSRRRRGGGEGVVEYDAVAAAAAGGGGGGGHHGLPHIIPAGSVRRIGRKVRGKLAGLLHCLDRDDDDDGGNGTGENVSGGGDAGVGSGGNADGDEESRNLVQVPSFMWDHARGYLVTETHYREKLTREHVGPLVPPVPPLPSSAVAQNPQIMGMVSLALAVDRYLVCAERCALDPVQRVTRAEFGLVCSSPAITYSSTAASPWSTKLEAPFLKSHIEPPPQPAKTLAPPRPAIPKSPSAIFLQTHKPHDGRYHALSRALELSAAEKEAHIGLVLAIGPEQERLVETWRKALHGTYILQEALVCLRRVRVCAEYPWTIYGEESNAGGGAAYTAGYHHRHLIRSRWASQDRSPAAGSTATTTTTTTDTTAQELRLLHLLSHLCVLVYNYHTTGGSNSLSESSGTGNYSLIREAMTALWDVDAEWRSMRAWDRVVSLRAATSNTPKNKGGENIRLTGAGPAVAALHPDSNSQDAEGGNSLVNGLLALGWGEVLESVSNTASSSGKRTSKSSKPDGVDAEQLLAHIKHVLGLAGTTGTMCIDIGIAEWAYRASELLGFCKQKTGGVPTDGGREGWWFDAGECLNNTTASNYNYNNSSDGKPTITKPKDLGAPETSWVEQLVSGLARDETWPGGKSRLDLELGDFGSESEKRTDEVEEKEKEKEKEKDKDGHNETGEISIVLAAATQARTRRGLFETLVNVSGLGHGHHHHHGSASKPPVAVVGKSEEEVDREEETQRVKDEEEMAMGIVLSAGGEARSRRGKNGGGGGDGMVTLTGLKGARPHDSEGGDGWRG